MTVRFVALPPTRNRPIAPVGPALPVDDCDCCDVIVVPPVLPPWYTPEVPRSSVESPSISLAWKTFRRPATVIVAVSCVACAVLSVDEAAWLAVMIRSTMTLVPTRLGRPSVTVKLSDWSF